MNTISRFKLFFLVIFFTTALAIGYYFLLPSDLNQELGLNTNTAVDGLFGWKIPIEYPVVKFPMTGSGNLAYSDIRDPGGIPQGLPVRLKIPVIGVDSAIEDALITSDGRMDVPAGSVNVAWFALGPHPGQVGSAVIGGHFGINNNVPFVFYKLDQLKIGDKIYVIDDDGNNLGFMVREIKLFPRDADPTTVFTSSDGLSHLNLITCEGIWNKVNDTYPDRRVVFTDAITVNGAFVPKSILLPRFPRSLSLGSKGADVIDLQNILEKKDFLIMPPGVSKGYFGSLTSRAVTKYQTSTNLPSVGVFGPLTRARMIADETVAVEIPELPLTDITRVESPFSQKVFFKENLIRSIKSLYATPLDGLVTLLLFVAIVFVTFKIIKR